MPQAGFIMEADIVRLIQVMENGSIDISDRLAAYGELKRLNWSSEAVDNFGRELLEEVELSQLLNAVDPPFQVVLLCIYTLAASLSLVGNTTAIVVLRFGKSFWQVSEELYKIESRGLLHFEEEWWKDNLWSSAELRAFLVNLAVADITMAGFSIPFTYTIYVWGHWMFMPAFCPIAISMQHVAVLVSVYTLTLIGYDRYKALCHPFETRVTKTKTKSLIAVIWLAAFGVSSIQLVVTKAEPFEHAGNNYTSCEEKWRYPWQSKAYTIFVFVITFVLPLLGILVAYCAIARCLYEQNAPGNADHNRDQMQLRAKRKVIKMLFTIVALFAICWFPLQLYNLLFFFVPGFGTFRTNYGRHVYALCYLGCHWLANANSFVNPLIYCFMSDNFRADFKDILKSLRERCGGSKSQPPDRSLSTRVTTANKVDCCLEMDGLGQSEGGGATRIIGVPYSMTSAVTSLGCGLRDVVDAAIRL